jgi:hypothetical protein
LFVNYTPKNWDGYSGFKTDDVIPLRDFTKKTKEQIKTFLLTFLDGLALISKHYSAIIRPIEDESFLKEFGKPKENKGEFIVLLGKEKKVSDKPFDVYARVMTGKDGLPIAVFAVDLGGAFMNSREHPNQSEAMERLLIQFGIDCSNTGIDEEVKLEQKILKTLEKEQNNLEKGLSGYEKDIADYKEKIKETERKISDVKSNQAKKKDAFKAQESKIEAIERKRKTLN